MEHLFATRSGFPYRSVIFLYQVSVSPKKSLGPSD